MDNITKYKLESKYIYTGSVPSDFDDKLKGLRRSGTTANVNDTPNNVIMFYIMRDIKSKEKYKHSINGLLNYYKTRSYNLNSIRAKLFFRQSNEKILDDLFELRRANVSAWMSRLIYYKLHKKHRSKNAL